jgi:hypothetical protein
VNDIKKIPVGRAETEDYLAWNYTKNGIFSVRSAYHLKRQLNILNSDCPGSSLSDMGTKEEVKPNFRTPPR